MGNSVSSGATRRIESVLEQPIRLNAAWRDAERAYRAEAKKYLVMTFGVEQVKTRPLTREALKTLETLDDHRGSCRRAYFAVISASLPATRASSARWGRLT